MEFKEKLDMLNEILDIVKQYPENLQEKVFDFSFLSVLLLYLLCVL